jgi:hypothetical protein
VKQGLTVWGRSCVALRVSFANKEGLRRLRACLFKVRVKPFQRFLSMRRTYLTALFGRNALTGELPAPQGSQQVA